jgi:signal transduction histidine kinase
VLISLVLSFLAFSTGLEDIGSMNIPDTGTRDFLILMGISAVSSLGLIAVKKMTLTLLLLSIRLITILLIGVPFGESLSTEFYLITAIIIDISFALPFKTAFGVILITIAACVASQADINAYYFHVGIPSENKLIAYGSWAVVFGIFSLYVNDLRARFRLKAEESDHRRLVIEELIGANRGYLEYASAVELETSEKERKRIITELHDVVGQSFTNILAITDMAEKHPPNSEELTDLFSVVRSQAGYGLDETRAVLYKLHTFKPTGPTGLMELHRMIAVFSKSTQLKVDVNWANLPWDLGPELNDTVFNVIRESLINSFRHGKATQLSIHFRVDHAVLHIDIIDNGQGAKSIKKGIGLSAMEERVVSVKGQIRFSSRVGEFSINIRIPVKNSSSVL